MSSPQPTLERVWLAYLVCVTTVAVCADGGGDPGHRPGLFVVVHAAVGALVLTTRWLVVHRSADAARLPRVAVAAVGLPVVFSALCWLLPAVHPEPYEYVWLDVDRWLFGTDLARLAEHLPRVMVEVLQLDYALFYLLCFVAVFATAWCSGQRAFDRAMLIVVGGFLTSYLGYLLVPTIAPKLVLVSATQLEGVWLTATLRAWIDGAESNHWDCFPSGHTMMTIVSLIVMHRWARAFFWWFLLPGLLLIVSTMLLRYHWASDVVAGALLAWPCVRLCDWLADRDGWPAVRTRAAVDRAPPTPG